MFKSATAVILNDNKFLLIKRGKNLKSSPGKWFFPGWRCEWSETPEENAIREVREDTGLTFDLNSLILEYKSDTTHRHRFIWTATWIISIQEEEVDDYGWFTYHEAIKLEIAFEWVEHIHHLKENWHITE